MDRHNGLCQVNYEINVMKQLLERTVKQHMYNFRHPEVVKVSQRLDTLIVQAMSSR